MLLIVILTYKCYRIVNYYWMQTRIIEPVTIVERVVYFQNELNADSKAVKLQLCYLGNSHLINLTQTLKISNLQRELITNSHIFYMDLSTRICQHLGIYPFNEDIFLEIDPKKKERLHFKFRKIGKPMAASGKTPEQLKQIDNNNNRKSRERTIGQVRLHLQNRNQIYRNVSQSGEYCTLQQAADMIGLPKKTLDDYDRYIRMAETYGFDFERHKNAGMGVLRNFVRQHQQKQKNNSSQIKVQFVEPDVFWNISQKSRN